ncbi:hypothetical protein QNI19_07830 [Cytophagaceae bacterium DM2B3-1]|uniref:Transporter n=1 Tax=Xanthocytophaga flava TaxID=3048013 RepID=A0ABT7CGG7_9BACT|nr:hypothetical protein [Xanthocytophaga flavus]MDJ1492838.1 hypothetical protein [Xanthocytophaga flavus]
MKIRHLIVGLACYCLTDSVLAQSISPYVSDALQFSQSQPFGTTRFQSMGGVNTALGADISSISGNPAGLGFYRKSDFSITPSLNFTNNKSTFIGRQLSDGTTFFNVPNFGIVFSGAKKDTDNSLWRGGSFGISYNRNANFRNVVTFQGNSNSANSIAVYFRGLADALDLPSSRLDVADDQIGFNVGYNQAMAQLAYKGYLIEGYDSDNDGNQDVGNYYITNLSRNATVDPQTNELIEDPFEVSQSETWTTTGGRSQWSFAWGGNWADKLYMGVSLGISSIRYESTKGYTEVVNESTLNFLDQFTVTDNLKVNGTGFNATLGLNYRPVDWVRIGWSFSTPTLYRLNEVSFTSLSTRVKDPSTVGGNNPIGFRTVDNEFDYNLTTPLRTSVGIAFFFEKYGFISGDVEYMPYKGARIGGSDWSTDNSGLSERVTINNQIKQTYTNTFNYRVGGEFRYQIFRIRAGFAYQTDPYQQRIDDLNRSLLSYSGGVGIKLSNFYSDLGVMYSQSKGGYTPYQLPGAPSATTQYNTTSVMLTIGSSF